MQIYDVLMLVILVGYMLFGLLKGMAWQLASLGSLVVSALVAIHFSPTLAPMISRQEPWNRYLAMFVLYLATSLVIWLLFRFVRGAIDRVRLKEFDRQIGAIFGLTKGFLLCLLITFFAVTLSEPARQAVLKARSGKLAAVLVRDAVPILPEEIRESLGKYIAEFDRKLDPNTPADSKQGETESPTRDAVKGAAEPAVKEATRSLLKQLDQTGAGGQQGKK